MKSCEIYGLAEVLAKQPKKTTSIYAAVNRGTFPKPVPVLGLRSRVGWPAHEVNAILEACMAGADEDDLRVLVAALHAARAPLPAVILDARAAKAANRSTRERQPATRKRGRPRKDALNTA